MSKLEFRVLVELFPISRLQRASSQSVRAISVRFVPVRNCVTSGIMLLDYVYKKKRHVHVQVMAKPSH